MRKDDVVLVVLVCGSVAMVQTDRPCRFPGEMCYY